MAKVKTMVTIMLRKVVSRNIFVDMISGIQNMFGGNLTGYEKMIDKANSQIQAEIKAKGYSFKWVRYEMTQLSNGALAILYYGDLK